MITLKRCQCCIQRTGNGTNLAQFGRRQMVGVAINRAEAVLAGIDLPANAIETRHEQGSEEQAGVRSWIGRAKLEAFRLRVVGQWNAHCSTSVTFRENQVDRSLIARYQSLIAIGGRGRDCQQCWSVREQSPDIVAGRL